MKIIKRTMLINMLFIINNISLLFFINYSNMRSDFINIWLTSPILLVVLTSSIIVTNIDDELKKLDIISFFIRVISIIPLFISFYLLNHNQYQPLNFICIGIFIILTITNLFISIEFYRKCIRYKNSKKQIDSINLNYINKMASEHGHKINIKTNEMFKSTFFVILSMTIILNLNDFDNIIWKIVSFFISLFFWILSIRYNYIVIKNTYRDFKTSFLLINITCGVLAFIYALIILIINNNILLLNYITIIVIAYPIFNTNKRWL